MKVSLTFLILCAVFIAGNEAEKGRRISNSKSPKRATKECVNCIRSDRRCFQICRRNHQTRECHQCLKENLPHCLAPCDPMSAPPGTCLARNQLKRGWQELMISNGNLTYACCTDKEIKTCNGHECGAAATSCARETGCVITGKLSDLENTCQNAHPNTLFATNCDHINHNNGSVSCISDDHHDDHHCFAPDAKVKLKSGKEKLMKDLNLGEEVMSDDKGGVTEFVGWLDKSSKGETDFLQITTSKGGQVTLTGSHVVFYLLGNTPTSIFARNLVPGDVLVGEHGQGKIIHSIEGVIMTGSLSPLTRSGTIMANGIYSSCYASFPHQLANVAMLPARLFPALFLDNEETLKQDGTRPYVATIKWIGRALGFGRKDKKTYNEGVIMKSGEDLFTQELMVPYGQGQFCQLLHK